MSESYDFGLEAETKAVHYLTTNGYEILDRNFRFGKAEVDIIAKYQGFLVIVEVKARTSSYFGLPESFVTPKKIKLLVRAVDHYIQKNRLDLEVRFDIITYLKVKEKWQRDHIKNAFYPHQ